MKKILAFVLAVSLLSANTLSAHSTNEGDAKAKQNQSAQPDSSLSVNEELQLLDKIANDAEEIYYSQGPGKQSPTDIKISSNTMTKKEEGCRKSSHK